MELEGMLVHGAEAAPREELLSTTYSICPVCLTRIPAQLVASGNRIWMIKGCAQHGKFRDLYWSDLQLYRRFLEHGQPGNPPGNCPFNCSSGLCSEHSSPTALAIINLTNRCNLKCPTCFAGSGSVGQDPPIDQLYDLLNFLADLDPRPLGIQFSGGEPTLRDELPDLVRYSRELGFYHIEVNTNGLRLCDLEYMAQLSSAGVGAFYLQFDGITQEPYLIHRGKPLLRSKLEVIQNAKKLGANLVLVPTIAKGVNHHQLGDLIRFAIQNCDVVRCVNFQPISFCGRIWLNPAQHRITIPDLIGLIESQTHGLIQSSDFYPVPVVEPLIRLLELINSRKYAHLSCHALCGAATYLFLDGDPIPITRLAPMDSVFQHISRAAQLLADGSDPRNPARAWAQIGAGLRLIHPRLRDYISRMILAGGHYGSLREIHHRMLMVGIMHFMDGYNFDLNRVNRCVIHYALPGGRLIPFCRYNLIQG